MRWYSFREAVKGKDGKGRKWVCVMGGSGLDEGEVHMHGVRLMGRR